MVKNSSVDTHQDVRNKTLGSNSQAWAGKNLPYKKESAHREYYKIALNLQDIQDGKQDSRWILEHNELLKVKNIANKGLQSFIKNKITASENKILNDSELNSTDVIVVRPSSPLSKMVTNSKEINEFVNSNLENIKNGKFANNSNAGLKFAFPDKKQNNKNYSNEFAVSHTIHCTNIYDAKMIDNNTLSLVVVDYYDFAPGGGMINDNAHIQQENNQLKNYVLLVPIKIKVSK